MVVWAGDERGRGKGAHQRVKRLVGGRLGRDEQGRGRMTHQRVVATRWWSFGPGTSEGGKRRPTNESLRLVGGRLGLGRGREGEGGPPMSLYDLLVVDRAWDRRGWREKLPNELQ